MFPRMVLPIHCEITDGILRGAGRAFHAPVISPPGGAVAKFCESVARGALVACSAETDR